MATEVHKVVCQLHPIQQSQRHVYFQYAPDGDERREGFYMTRKVWNEMERPGVITVTIELGNQLVEEETHQQNVLDRIPNRIPGVNLAVGTEVPTHIP